MQAKFNFCLFVSLVLSGVLAEDAPEVKIDQGVLRGRVLKTEQGRPFHSFTGIPYAKPPVGLLRFEAPVAADPWEGVLDATKPHAICPQMNTYFRDFNVVGNEDCLYLNIYTPKSPLPNNALRPVMAYFHGGGFFIGTAGKEIFGPEILLDKEIVLVTINYRLGPLGFLTTGDEVIPGNNGLKDQAFALKWIKKNIEQFGGNPNKITVFGESAGGASAEYHLYSPLSRDLISGSISQSGGAFCLLSLAPIEVIANRTRTLAELVNCPISDNKEMVKCLRNVDAHDIIKQIPKFLITDIDPMLIFKPVIETKSEGAFLEEDPVDTIVSGKSAKVPLMVGTTADDGAFRTAGIYDMPDVMQKLNDNFNEVGPIVMDFYEFVTGEAKDNISKQIRSFYFGDKPIDESTKRNFTDMYTDAIFLHPAETAVELLTKHSDQPVYYYLFDYHGTVSYCPLFGNGTAGVQVVCHGDDLIYLFKSDTVFPNYKPNEEDRKFIDFLTTLWTNFATHGNPTPATDSLIQVKWNPVQKGKKNYYHIKGSADVELKENLREERAKFWLNLPIDSRRIRIKSLL